MLMSVKFRLLVLLTTATFLSACDGGITGTGGPILESPDSSSNGPTIVGEGPGIETSAPSGDVAVQALDSDIDFANNVDATLRSDSILKIVHTVNNLPPVFAILNQDASTPLIPQPGINFGEGADFYLSVAADTHELDVIAIGAEPGPSGLPLQIAGINPLSLSVGSASTFVLRGIPDDGSAAAQTYPVRLLAVPNVLSTNNADTINIRILHAAPNFDAEGSIDIFIRPADSTNPTTGLSTFESFNYAAGNTGYFETPVDSYSITATDANGLTQRIPTTAAISPAAGSSTTIIILDDPNGVPGVDVTFLIMNDGDRTGLPDL